MSLLPKNSSHKQRMDKNIANMKVALSQLTMCVNTFKTNVSSGKPQNLLFTAKVFETLLCKITHELDELLYHQRKLYKNRGRVSSDPDRARRQAQASRVNGAKGGRPPKEITEAKKRYFELANKDNKTGSDICEMTALFKKIADWNEQKKIKLIQKGVNDDRAT